jgi:hypothetical protein
MKTMYQMTICALLLCMVNNLFATVASHVASTPQIQLTTFSVKDYQQMVGKKLSLKDKIVFHYAKRDLLKKAKTTNQETLAKVVADTGSGFNLGGFLLGFFFSIVGVLVALLFGRNVLRWAWRGFLAGLVLVLAGYLVSKASA